MLSQAVVSFAQDAQNLLNASYNKCQSIQHGYYEMTKCMYSSTTKDTSKTIFFCHFKKLKEDTIYGLAFHFKTIWQGKFSADVLYTGNEQVVGWFDDSSATIKTNSMWAKEIKQYNYSLNLYAPFTNLKSIPVQHDSDFIDNKCTAKLVKEEELAGTWCYHIQVNKTIRNDSPDIKMLKEEYHYWIRKEDFIPVQYSIVIDEVISNDTMHFFENNILNKYEVKNLNDENVLTVGSLPTFFRIKDYVKGKKKLDPLPKDTIAPDWELPSLTNTKVSLKELKGELVMVDFFFKNCPACMFALPYIERLSNKYKSKGLRVIGIDPYDKKEDDLDVFLVKRKITYQVLLGTKEVEKDYRVSYFPTLFLIDKKGKIIFTQVGYDKGDEAILEELIKNNL